MIKWIVIIGSLVIASLVLSTTSIKSRRTFRSQRVRRSNDKSVLVGGIFQSDARNSFEHVAFKEKISKLRPLKYDIKTKIVYVKDISDSFQISGAICQLLVSKVIAIFGPIHPRTVHTIQSLSDSHDLLYITTSDVHHYASESIEGRRRGNNIIKLRSLVANAVVDFIQAESWNRILYLYDSNEALFRLRMIFEHTNSRRVDLSADARQYSAQSSSAAGILKYINRKSKLFSKKHIILDLKDTISKQMIIKQMDNDLKMDRLDYHYLVTEIDQHEITSQFIQNGGTNFTMLCPLDYNNPKLKRFLRRFWHTPEMMQKYPQLFHTDVLRKMIPLEAALIIDGIDVLANALNVALPSKESHRENSDKLICTPPQNPMFTAKQLQRAIVQSPIDGISGLVQFDSSGFRVNYKLDIYEARVKVSMDKIGNWTTSRGLNMELGQRRSATTKIDGNRPLRVTSILAAPFLMYKKDKYGRDTKELEGFCAALIEKMSQLLKFNYTLQLVKDEQYGANVNGTWNGMIGELMNNTADIAVAPLTITSSRERVVDFSTPFMEFGLSVMYVKMKPPDAEPFDFMKPLSSDIWMCISYAYLAVSVVLFLVSRFNPYEWTGVSGNHNNNDPDAPSAATNKMANDITIFNSFWFSLSAFMQQGGDIAPRSLAGRIVGGVWWFFTLIIVSSYTANLAAYLTKERMNNPISSYEDLANQNDIKYGVVNSGSSKEFFSKSTIDVFSRMWTQMESNPDVFMSSVQAGVEKVINSTGNFAFILESTMNEYYNQRKPCMTEKIGTNLDSGKGYGIATPPGSKLRDPINLAVLELKEKNTIPGLREFWWKSKSECNKDNQTEEEDGISQNSVKLGDIKGLFYVLSGGLAIGLLFSVLELFYKCALESKRRNKRFWKTLKIMLNHSSLDTHNNNGSQQYFHRNSSITNTSSNVISTTNHGNHSNIVTRANSNPSNNSLVSMATTQARPLASTNRSTTISTNLECAPLTNSNSITTNNDAAINNNTLNSCGSGKLQYSF